MPRTSTHDRLGIQPGHVELIPAHGAFPAQAHVFDKASIQAVNAALAAGRPLLVRGEPGTGKSQLAEAAARALGRAFIPKVVDARTESRDLLWSFDAVARLARAQVLGALADMTEARADRELDERSFVRPGPLWWAFDWQDAARYGEPPVARPDGWSEEQGSVLLIDEIDKADSDVPNGLLEALGSGRFTPQGFHEPVTIRAGCPLPLVVVTTNEERALPDAFLRRCLVLQLGLPKEPAELVDLLVSRAGSHFREASGEVLRAAAEMLVQDRADVKGRGLAPPGQAEYLDLLRAVLGLASRETDQLALLRTLAEYTYRKHPAEPAA